MNYFELFEIPVQLKVDKSTLTKRFFELSRRFHPDYFATAGEEAQAEALEKSAQLNKAFKTFQHPDSTLQYALELKGLLEENEKYQLPPDFLAQMMEINEQLMDAKMEDDPQALESIRTALSSLEKDIYAPVEALIIGYRDGFSPIQELLPVKEYYYKKKYLERLKEQLAS
jgi:molecular chaperone HscB